MIKELKFMLSWINGIFRKMRPIEDVNRLANFFKKTGKLSWERGEARISLASVFNAVDELAMAEVQYYYRQRTTRRKYSRIARLTAWALGSGGLFAPLISAAEPERFQSFTSYGYVLIAAAASVLTLNSIMGGTDGHIRFTATQIRLEQIITKFRIEWFSFLAMVAEEKVSWESGFEIITCYAAALHEETVSETSVWGKTLTAELEKIKKTLES